MIPNPTKRMIMGTERWISVDTVVENGQVHVLQQKVKVSTIGTEYGMKLDRSNEHRLVPLDELEGIRPNDADVAGVDHVA